MIRQHLDRSEEIVVTALCCEKGVSAVNGVIQCSLTRGTTYRDQTLVCAMWILELGQAKTALVVIHHLTQATGGKHM